MTTLENETLNNLAADLTVETSELSNHLHLLAETDSKYLKDLRINLKNALGFQNLSRKESLFIALATCINEKNNSLIPVFEKLAKAEGASKEEFSEIRGCVSLMNTNNVFYRFRHFTQKDFYNQTPAGIKMGIMVNPILGKEFFELLSLVLSALNGCELCVNAHENSVLKLGSSEARIYDAVRCASIIKGFAVLN